MDTLIQGATLLTLDAERRVFEGDVLLRDGRIEAVGKRLKAPAKAKRIDARGKHLLPGFVQPHVHLCQTLFRNRADEMELLDWLRERIWPLEGAHDARSMRTSAELGIAELLRSGTTCILDMGSVHHHDAVFETAARLGLRYVGGKAMMDVGEAVPASLRESTADSLSESDRLRDRWHGAEGGRLRYAYCPRFVLSCSEGLLREVGQRSLDSGCLIHTHASENPTECRVVREQTGHDNVDWFHELGLLSERMVLAHGIWLSARERKRLAKSGAHLVHCPSSNLKLASGVAKVPETMAEGLSWGLATDGAPCNNNHDMFMEMRLAALLPKPRLGPRAMPCRDVLELATLGGARVLGLEAEIGSIEPGKRADLQLLDLRRLHSSPGGPDPYVRVVLSANASNVDTVWVEGRPLVEGGRLRELDEAELVGRAEREARRIARRVGLP